ncbi:MAG: NUDIX domain-containing protein [Pseudonocardiaceae bacterium]
MSPPEEIGDALRRFRRRRARRWGFQRASLAVTVITGATGPAVVLNRRIGPPSTGAGQFELPGGPADRWEPASGAARRQLAGELGVRLPPESTLGLLDDYVTHTGLVITPVVLWAGTHWTQLQVPAAEVLAVPFADLDVEPVFVASAGSDRRVIRLPVLGGWLHAPTAAVLHQFREVVLYGRRTRVAHLEQPVGGGS